MTTRKLQPENEENNDQQDTAIHQPPTFAIAPPIEPMLARLTEELPAGDGWLYEPKWDGFRAIVFRGNSDVFIQSRDLRPLDP
jgi:ATP-dependent DNA ligase